MVEAATVVVESLAGPLDGRAPSWSRGGQASGGWAIEAEPVDHVVDEPPAHTAEPDPVVNEPPPDAVKLDPVVDEPAAVVVKPPVDTTKAEPVVIKIHK